MNDNARVAVLSVHTSPMDQPGTGDSGGMNVYMRAVAERLAGRGVAVDVFTRCRGGDDHEVKLLGPGIRVVSVKAGPCDARAQGRAAAVPAGVPRRGAARSRTRTGGATTSCTATTGSPAGSAEP